MEPFPLVFMPQPKCYVVKAVTDYEYVAPCLFTHCHMWKLIHLEAHIQLRRLGGADTQLTRLLHAPSC